MKCGFWAHNPKYIVKGMSKQEWITIIEVIDAQKDVEKRI